MAVIEALMMLFVKEQVSMEKVLNTVKRFSAPVSASEAPTDPDSALLLWAKRCSEALKTRIEAEMKTTNPSEEVCALISYNLKVLVAKYGNSSARHCVSFLLLIADLVTTRTQRRNC
jgi:hypothetical protein